ncbi:MAG: septal ring lytic transglycosylase RlpA family protein [Bacteroidota bacterium]
MALLTAGILSAIGTGSYVSWTANAGESAPLFDSNHDATVHRTIDVDSLYTAKAEESTPTDTSSIAELTPDRTVSGRVSWYGPGFNGRRTANGERFDKNEMSAAHKTLPFGSLVRVVDVASGKGVLVRVNDRGPYCGGRVLDLSEGAARRIGIAGKGTASARLEIYPMEHSAAQGGASASRTFDSEGRGVMPHGYSVKVAELASFDEASVLQHTLNQQGYSQVYLAEVHRDGKVNYQVLLGLFSSDRLCGTLIAEVADRYPSAEIIHFRKGMPMRMELATK